MTRVLLPMSVFNRGVDDHFASERDAAKAAGFDVAYVGFEPHPVAPAFNRLVHFIYRGWMMTPVEYGDFIDDALEHNGHNIVNRYQYEVAHWFCYWYSVFKNFTPASLWMPASSTIDLMLDSAESLAFAAKRNFGGQVMVKDYVKASRIESNFTCDSSYAIDTYDCLKGLIYERDGAIEGGLVVREWEKLSPHEFRVWFMNGKPTFVSPHQCEISSTPSPYEFEFLPVLDSPFYCVDVALGAKGDWRVIEVGDGGVSSVAESHMADFYMKLYEQFG